MIRQINLFDFDVKYDLKNRTIHGNNSNIYANKMNLKKWRMARNSEKMNC